MKYEHKVIEQKWKKNWEESGLYKTGEDETKPKYYILDMFPYPSGAGLHVGHPKGYIATDIFARMKRMQGFNVLHPMGWDAFGLPAENYAIKNKVHPKISTDENIATFKRQLGKLGFSYDWDREINTTDPEFYKWSQWIFLEMFKRGLAFESYDPINWCPSCKTGLANEDLEDGRCERCDSEIEKKPMRQWVLKITDYADRMLEDLDGLDEWDNSIKEMQRGWIGRSEGAHVDFELEGEKLKVFTTRPDTLFGATFMVLAPEHELVEKNKDKIENFDEIKEYIKKAQNKSDLERTDLNKDKSGVELKGLKAINPVNGKKIPVFIADYVLAGYGTGAIMAVPGHDERDWEFAKKYDLEIIEVVSGGDVFTEAYSGNGVTVNSAFLDGLEVNDAKAKMSEWLVENKKGEKAVNYKLKDWVFSRQRYWGEPIPIVHCDTCKNKKYNYILVHGHEGSDKFNYHAWLKSELEKEGHEVTLLNLPNTNTPSVVEQGDYVLENAEINEDTIFVGHSLGAPVILNLLERSGKKVEKVLLVDGFVTPKFNDYDDKAVPSSFDWKFDFGKIKSLVNEFEVLADETYCTIPEEGTIELAEKLGVDPVFKKSVEGHFCALEEPEVLRRLEITGAVAVPESELPLRLPEVEHYEPSGTGESPLATIDEWVNTTCPKCGGAARRETNTMPQWAGSSWYYLRYIDPKNNDCLVDPKKEKYWSPVDFYVGGAEHATRHLIYARFWHKFLFDIGVVSHKEPFTRLQHVGLIMAEDGRKMSKRWGNVINPDDIVEEYGADVMRVYEMFMGPFAQSCAWNTKGLVGARKFLDRIYRLSQNLNDNTDKKLLSTLHKTLKKVGDDIIEFKLNTAISSMMIFVNEAEKSEGISKDDFKLFLQVLAPFAPHICEEMYTNLGENDSVFLSEWPKYDAALCVDDTINLVVQVNGKVRATISISADIEEEKVKKIALENEDVQKWLEDKEVVKVIYVRGKLISIVVK